MVGQYQVQPSGKDIEPLVAAMGSGLRLALGGRNDDLEGLRRAWLSDQGRRTRPGANRLAAALPAGKRHLRGLSFTTAAWHDLGERDAATWLFRPTDEPSLAGRAHIEAGHAAGVQNAYKCRIRQPWWRVPLLRGCSTA